MRDELSLQRDMNPADKTAGASFEIWKVVCCCYYATPTSQPTPFVAPRAHTHTHRHPASPCSPRGTGHQPPPSSRSKPTTHSRMAMSGVDVDKLLKSLMLKDMRIQCRGRGLSPAGGKEQLTDRLKEHMIATNDFALRTEAGDIIQTVEVLAGSSTADMEGGCLRNNYSRPEGQNVGNYMTDRPSSRVLAAPGGASSIVFGDEGSPYAPAARTGRGRAPGALANAEHQTTNNYSRPEGQNVGNYITGRNSTKVHAPPGGASQIHFG